MRKIGYLLERKKKEPGEGRKEKKWDEKGIFIAFQRVIKEEYGNQGLINFRPDFWKDGKLFVRTQGSVWASELQIRREEMKRRINAELGQDEIREIKLKN